MTNITYWGDMLNAVNAYVSATYGTSGTAYRGPNGAPQEIHFLVPLSFWRPQ